MPPHRCFKEAIWALEMVKTLVARGPDGLEKMSLGCNVKSASGWTMGGDRTVHGVGYGHGTGAP
jgi:hypothetical protein